MSNPNQDIQPPLLAVRNLVKNRGRNYRLIIPEMVIRPGARILLLGDSGSGKSTTLDMLALVLKPDEADAFLWRPETKNTDLHNLWLKNNALGLGRLRREELGYVLQTGGLIPFLTVRENILLAAKLKKMTAQDQEDKFKKLVQEQELDIGHLADKYPDRISVGQRQRCAIARAVIHSPALVLADEPTASLDPPTADRVFNLLLTFCRDSALIVASHDESRAETHGFTVLRVNCQSGEGSDGLTTAELRPA